MTNKPELWINNLKKGSTGTKAPLKSPIFRLGLSLTGVNKVLLGLCLLLGFSVLGYADDGGVLPIGTSRPSVIDTATTVPKGSLQVETGSTYSGSRGGTGVLGLPEVMLRVGILANTELRFVLPTAYLSSPKFRSLSETDSAFWGDIQLGISHHWGGFDFWDVALVSILNLPTGTGTGTHSSVDPQCRIVVSRSIQNVLLTTHFDSRWYITPTSGVASVFGSGLIGSYAITPTVSGFLEWAVTAYSSGQTEHIAQTGIAWLLTPVQQVDVRLATGLTPQSPDFWAGIGYSLRWDGIF